MAKKKAPPPKDDLIDQLLDDVNDIAADASLDDEMESSDEEGAPAGFVDAKPRKLKSDTVYKLNNPWESLEEKFPEDQADEILSGVNLSISMKSAPQQESGLNPIDFPLQQDDQKERFQGPSYEIGYQAPDFESAEGHENEATRQISSGEAPGSMPSSSNSSSSDDRTHSIQGGGGAASIRVGTGMDHEATLAAEGFGQRRNLKNEPQEKVVIGSLRGSRAGNVFTTMDASLAQAENLKMAQQRILDLEKENDRLRQENEEVSSAAEIIRNRLEEMTSKITALDREKKEIQESAHNEMMILKGNLLFKESEVAKARLKIDELDTRLRNDFKKIRVKERELENRLELARAEKAALVRAKDENILELKRKVDQQQSEIDNYREKLLELNKTIDASQEQFKRTVRALRLALSNLESKDDNLVPFKKVD